MYEGIEVDMLSLGDADCIVVTQYHAQMGAKRSYLALGLRFTRINGWQNSHANMNRPAP